MRFARPKSKAVRAAKKFYGEYRWADVWLGLTLRICGMEHACGGFLIVKSD
jgi:hypothetical protein